MWFDNTGGVRGHRVAIMLCAFVVMLGVLCGSVDQAEAFCRTGTDVLEKALVSTCWECMFPVSMSTVTLYSGTEMVAPPAAGPGLAAFPPQLCGCICVLDVCVPGLPIGYFEPVRLLEAVHDQFCFPTFGVSLSGGGFTYIGTGSESTQIESLEHNHLFMHVHYMAFPLWYIVGLLTDTLCVNDSIEDIDVLFVSEIDPTWDDDFMSLILQPEALLIANPIAVSACAADGLAATVSWPIDALFWCAGSAGLLYPMDGNVSGAGNDIQGSALLTYRMLAKLARIGGELWTSANGPAICYDLPTGLIVKSQYKFQLLYPIPNYGGDLSVSSCCHPLGRTSMMWGNGHEVPAMGEDFVWLMWKNQNCCML